MFSFRFFFFLFSLADGIVLKFFLFFFDVKVCFRRNTRVFVRGLLKDEKVFLCVTR